MLKCTSIVLLAVMACSMAAIDNKNVEIISMDSDIEPDGKYHYSYESGDGTKAQVVADLKVIDKEKAIKSEQGSYQYVGDDGKTYSVQFKADENGFQPIGDHIPKIPDLIQKSLDFLATAPPPKDK